MRLDARVDKVSLLCSIDGRITSVEEGTVPVTDEGFLRGDGAFELLKLYGGRPFALADHLNRLDVSCEGIFLEWDRPQFEAEIEALLAENEREDAYLRLVQTRQGRRIALLEQPMSFAHDMTLSSVAYQPTIVLTGLKTLSYAANMAATRAAQQSGAREALLVLPDGTVLEAPTSSIFWVTAEGVLRTPELDSGILASITRDRVLRLLPAEEGRYRLADIAEASEVFLASTIREVQGVKEVDGLTFESPGPVTQRVAGLLSERIQAELAATP
jgi:branched-chain amino acid aminotransferase